MLEWDQEVGCELEAGVTAGHPCGTGCGDLMREAVDYLSQARNGWRV